MRDVAYAALVVGLSLALAPGARAAGEIILGDSIGAGVRDASGNEGPAIKNLHIRDKAVITQIKNVPADARAFLFLGTNDAREGSLRGIDTAIDNIVRAAQDGRVKLVWIGPSCVNKTWDQKIAQLDTILATRLAPTSVQYVSMRAEKPKLCPASLKGDGVHLTDAGYKQIWSMAFAAAETGRTAAGTVAPVGPQAAVAPTPDASQPATPPPPAAQPPAPPPPAAVQQPAPPPPAPVQQAAPPVQQAAPPAQPTPPPAPAAAQKPAPPAAVPQTRSATPASPGPPLQTTVTQPPQPRPTVRPSVERSRVVTIVREPIRIVVTPFVRSRGGPIRIALGLGPDPYLEPPFPLRRR
ncbi:MAG: hypothetical protein QOG38_1792 [Hyphomicrobiales bacterium]|nr:hypothetical protein [Hyphomicrobiales bacterium]